MKKQLLILTTIAALVMAGSLAFAASTHIKGKVTAVSGKSITIEVEKGSAADVAVGDSVEMEVKGAKAAPKKGKDMLQGC
jgi:hypothetical protein